MQRSIPSLRAVSPSGPAYAVILCPAFRLQAVKRHGGGEIPTALADGSRKRSAILCRNDAAARFGVEEGQPTVRAISRCPHLAIERPSPPAESVASRRMLEAALSWVPGVEETGPGLLTLDLGTQPPDEREAWAWETRARLRDAGLETAVGGGETPCLARIAAQAAWHTGSGCLLLNPGDRLDILDRLPLSIAGAGADLYGRLVALGLATLGSFARLRREAVAARLGEEGVALWLRLSGRLRRPLRLAVVEESFEESHEFEHGASESGPLLLLLHRSMERLAARVGATGRAVSAVRLHLAFADGSQIGRRLALPEPSRDTEALHRLVSGHLESLSMPAPVSEVRLRLEPAGVVDTQRTLFGKGLRNRHRCEETLERLRKLLGADQVGSPRRPATHRPDRFQRVELAAQFDGTPSPPSGPPPTGLVLRRYPVPHRATVQLRDGEPLRVETPHSTGLVVEASGPWRSDGGWWQRNQGWERVEWDVELLNHGLFLLVETGRGWTVEGYYD